MRITGGEARGITLKVPRGDAVRPATDGMRQAVFSSLAARVSGAWFWDFFAGSGSYGLEALSRGAAGGCFVEKDGRAAGCVRSNIEAVCKSLGRDQTGLQISQTDVLDWNPPAAGPLPNLIFVDPPYENIEVMAPRLFARLSDLLASQKDPVIVFEMPGEITLAPQGWTCVRRLGKGARQPTVAFFKRE